ncbi:MAG: peptidylprolyl isomerase, partial [Terriglobales bacterium]
VAPEDTVITIKGFCADSSQHGDACKTVITRAQFEKITDAVQPNMASPMRRNIANQYPSMLRMAAEAEKRGLDKGPMFDEKMALARLQVLAQEMRRALQEDSGKVSDADIESYYKKNEASYEEATFVRIFIPHTKQIVNPIATPKAGTKSAATTTPPPAPTDAQKKAAEEAMKQVATDIHARAVKGEDPDKLQKEAFVAAGLPNNATNTKMEKVRRAALPPNHQAAWELKPGEVSEVISDPSGAYYVYEMVSKETLPLDSVKTDIRTQISAQRYRESMQSFQGSVDLNDAYFGGARGPLMPSPRGPRRTDQPAPDPD